jgi:hypothetical protein
MENEELMMVTVALQNVVPLRSEMQERFVPRSGVIFVQVKKALDERRVRSSDTLRSNLSRYAFKVVPYVRNVKMTGDLGRGRTEVTVIVQSRVT